MVKGVSRLSNYQHTRSVTVLLILIGLIACNQQVSSQLVDFERTDSQGKPIRLSDFRGKWVIINFWASWCGPCIKEIPELLSFQSSHPDTIILGINFEELDSQALNKAISEFKITYPVIPVRQGDTPLVPFEPIKGLPSTFFVTPKGEFIASHVGPVTSTMIDEFIKSEEE